MKKLLYLLASVLITSHPVEAGKYFNYKDDGEGGKEIFFHKSGKKFKRAVAELRKFEANPDNKINYIRFHHDVSKEQKAVVEDMLARRIDGLVHKDGKIETRAAYKANAKAFLENHKKKTTTFNTQIALDLTTEGLARPYTAEAFSQAHSVSLNILQMQNQDWNNLKTLLAQSSPNKKIYIGGNELDESKVAHHMAEILTITTSAEFLFSQEVLKKLSVSSLEKALSGQQLLKCFPQNTKIMPLVNEYMDYGGTQMRKYREVCEHLQYRTHFKASYADYQNEQEQKKRLVQILKSETSLSEQTDLIADINKKEGYKKLPIHQTSFKRIEAIITEQRSFSPQNEHYKILKAEKESLIEKVLSQL